MDAKPSAEHKLFDKDVGEWDAVVDVYAGPTPTSSKGKMTSRLTCGGLWLVSDYVADSGFSGHGMWTWDAAKKKYVGVWADHVMSFLAPGEGTWDPATKTMTFWYEAKIGDKTVRWRQTTQLVDENTQLFKSFMPESAGGPEDAPKEMMKVVYTRRRAPTTWS